MNSNEIEKRLRTILRSKPEMMVQGQLAARLLTRLKVDDDSTRKHSNCIEEILCKLEADGEIKLHRTGKMLSGYKVIRRAEPHKTVVRPAAKPKPKSTPERSAPVEHKSPIKNDDDFHKLPVHEKATKALHVLQKGADKDGKLFVPSTVEFISEVLKISMNQAAEANKPLHTLGLRKSPRVPSDERPHWIDLEVTVVTKEMLAAAARSKSQAKAAEEQPVTIGGAAPQLLQIIKELEHDVERLTAERDEHASSARAAEGLVAIIKELEAKLEMTSRVMDEARERITHLEREAKSLQSENEALEERLRSADTLSPEVDEVLKRYNKVLVISYTD